MSKDIRTKAFVLRRTNYGESDRILNLLTENGAVSAIAHGVRKEKSKLAGGIELFCLSDVTLHEGKNNALHTLTSARMLEYYSKIPVDLPKLELASLVLKRVSKFAEQTEGPEYFNLVFQILSQLNTSDNLPLIETWFWFNLAKISGEEINLYRDTTGDELAPDLTYVWDSGELALRPQIGGNIGVNEIKMMRLMLAADLRTVARVEKTTPLVPSILHIAKSVNKV